MESGQVEPGLGVGLVRNDYRAPSIVVGAFEEPGNSVATDVPQNGARTDRVVARILDQIEVPRHQANIERVRRDGDAGVTAQARQGRTLRRSQLERVHQRAKEQEQLHARQHIAQAHASADAERHEVFRFLDFTFGREEPTRSKLLRLVPQFRIHVHRVQQRHHLRSGRYRVTV